MQKINRWTRGKKTTTVADGSAVDVKPSTCWNSTWDDEIPPPPPTEEFPSFQVKPPPPPPLPLPLSPPDGPDRATVAGWTCFYTNTHYDGPVKAIGWKKTKNKGRIAVCASCCEWLEKEHQNTSVLVPMDD